MSQVLSGLPSVVAVTIALPLNEILCCSGFLILARIKNRLDLKLGLISGRALASVAHVGVSCFRLATGSGRFDWRSCGFDPFLLKPMC